MDATASPRASTTPTAPDDRSVAGRTPDDRATGTGARPVAAAAALTLGVAQILHTQTVPFASVGDYVCEGAYALYLTAAVAAVLTLRRVHGHAPGWGRIGDAGALLYGLGHAVVAIPVTATFVLATNPPDPLGALYAPGIVLWLAGLVPLAIAAFRSAVVPRPVAVALPATLPLTMALGAAGPLVEALTWAVLGWSVVRAARRRAR
ncbi:hypothetical protein [Microbispora siamensis]|uniref:Uncharacterized protein n=1 Tax=Microbispora siamensis TaxID=564413 RepID=A0ABQ4GGU0_9ACTN|nr:hypothetical protein [Microbispora siamensis]GIH60616.1 hypothetical protein Msi02_14330 [Microbispora siamensis]